MNTAEQKRAIDSTKRQVVITASAGAGKTSTMIARVLDLVTVKKVPLSSIVMLTFTEAAAEEMRSRLADALIEAVKKAPAEERRALVEAIDFLPVLRCGTIDSFCYSLVKEHFELLNLSPLLTLIDEETAAAYGKKAMTQTMEEFSAEHLRSSEEAAARYYAFTASFGKTEEDFLQKAIVDLYEYAETTEDAAAFLARAKELTGIPLEKHPAIEEYLAFVRVRTEQALKAIKDLPLRIPSGAPSMLKKFAYYVNGMTDVLSCKSLDAIADTVVSSPVAPRISSKEEDAYLDASLQLAEAGKIYAAWRADLLFTDGNGRKNPFFKGARELKEEIAESFRSVLTLIDLTERYGAHYRAIKEEEFALDFFDVEQLAFRLFRDHGIGADIGCKYLLVDECQDLNPLQDALIRFVAGEDGLFIVGDVKQSIYRFRLSDPEIFHRRLERGAADPEGTDVIAFDENFRSSDAVIAFVNELFSHLMTREFGGVDYTPAHRGERHFGSGKVSCFFYEKESEERSFDRVYSVKEDEARSSGFTRRSPEGEWVRDRIRALIGKELRDTRDDKPFTVSYKDIAILSPSGMRSGNVQEEVVTCLREAGIPLNLGDFVRESEQIEVRALVDFLRLIESPHNDYALLSVMRSEMFDFTLEEIAEISLREGDSYCEKAEAAAAEGSTKPKELYDYLERMRFLSGALSLYDLVSLIVEERLRLRILNRTDGRKVFGEILSFVETLKQGRATASISEYLPYFDRYYKAAETGEVSERDAVSVMTVHKSKGMQFPIVFVIGLGGMIVSGRENQELVRMDKEYGVAKKGEEKNFLFELFRMKKIRELKEDRLRLLYVAFTRAKNELYLSGEKGKSDLRLPKEKAERMSEWIACAVGDKYSSDLLSSEGEKEAHAPIPKDRKSVPTREEDVLDLTRAFSYRYPHEKATVTGIKYTVTAINAMEDEGYHPPTSLFPEEKKMKGTAFHAVMERIPFSLESEKEVSDFLDKLVAEGALLPQDRKDLSARRVWEALCGVREIVGDRRVLREKSFLLHLPAKEAGVAEIEDEVEVQGKIDLLAMGDGEAIVLDYKLSALSREELAEKYRAQLELYALAVRKSFGVQRVRKYIFVLGRNEKIEL